MPRPTNFERECHFARLAGNSSSHLRARWLAGFNACRYPPHPCGPLACSNLSSSSSQSAGRHSCEHSPRISRRVYATSELMPRFRTAESPPTSEHECAGHVLSDGCDPPVGRAVEPACSPFARVALVILATNAERVPLEDNNFRTYAAMTTMNFK